MRLGPGGWRTTCPITRPLYRGAEMRLSQLVALVGRWEGMGTLMTIHRCGAGSEAASSRRSAAARTTQRVPMDAALRRRRLCSVTGS